MCVCLAEPGGQLSPCAGVSLGSSGAEWDAGMENGIRVCVCRATLKRTGASSAPHPQVTSYVGKTSSPLHMQRCRVVFVTLPETKVLFLCPHPKVMSVHGIRMFRKHSERERSKASLKQLAEEGF